MCRNLLSVKAKIELGARGVSRLTFVAFHAKKFLAFTHFRYVLQYTPCIANNILIIIFTNITVVSEQLPVKTALINAERAYNCIVIHNFDL